MASIFREHNSYCIHIDPYSDLKFRETVDNILKCYQQTYPQTYIHKANDNIPVFWGHFSIVEAELNCLRDLYYNGHQWRYALDLAGSEIMMKTNRELVRFLKKTDGAIHTKAVNMMTYSEELKERIKYKYHFPNVDKRIEEKGEAKFLRYVNRTLADPIPFNIEVYKGRKCWQIPRAFVKFVLEHPVALKFIGMIKIKTSLKC